MERVIGAVPAVRRKPHGPGSAGRKINQDAAPATPPAAYADAATGTQACCKPVVGIQLDGRGGTGDGRCNKGASGQQT
jgi:hypothetical protein